VAERATALPPEKSSKVEARIGDPSQCREQAAECVRLANEGTTPQGREFIELAKVWLKLAAQFESDKPLLDAMDDAQKARRAA
jgi:hypothetical protein